MSSYNIFVVFPKVVPQRDRTAIIIIQTPFEFIADQNRAYVRFKTFTVPGSRLLDQESSFREDGFRKMTFFFLLFSTRFIDPIKTIRNKRFI